MTSLIFDVIGRLYPKYIIMFENLRLTLAKKRCEWGYNKTIISETLCVFPFVKTSGYHHTVFGAN